MHAYSNTRTLLGVHTSVVVMINKLAKGTPTPRLAYERTDDAWIVTSSRASLALLEDLAINEAFVLCMVILFTFHGNECIVCVVYYQTIIMQCCILNFCHVTRQV